MFWGRRGGSILGSWIGGRRGSVSSFVSFAVYFLLGLFAVDEVVVMC